MNEYPRGNVESIEVMDAKIRQARFIKHKDLPELEPIADQNEKLLEMEKLLAKERRFNRMNNEEIRELGKYCKGLEIEIKLIKKACDGNPSEEDSDDEKEEDVKKIEVIKEKDNKVGDTDTALPDTTQEDTINSYNQEENMEADNVEPESKDIKNDIEETEVLDVVVEKDQPKKIHMVIPDTNNKEDTKPSKKIEKETNYNTKDEEEDSDDEEMVFTREKSKNAENTQTLQILCR